MSAPIFTTVFVAALLLSTAIKLWLASRQLRHVLAHRDKVPEAFSAQVELSAHQKAADYTRAKTQLSMLTVLFEVTLLLAFTLGGGLQLLADWSLATFSNPLAQGMAIIVAVLVLPRLLRMRKAT